MRTICRFPRSFSPFFAAVVVLFCLQPAFAMRLARYHVLLDGKLVLEAHWGDNGGDADKIWLTLKRLDFQPVRGFKVEAESSDPLRATLKGKVVVEELYGGRAECAELPLVRGKADDTWAIAPAEIDRTLKARHKPLRFSISVNGKPVLWSDLGTLTGSAGDDSISLWRSLKRQEFRPINKYKVEAESGDPLRANLKGILIIREYYAGHDGGQVEASELTLVRDSEESRWRLAEGEVERTFKSRGKAR